MPTVESANVKGSRLVTPTPPKAQCESRCEYDPKLQTCEGTVSNEGTVNTVGGVHIMGPVKSICSGKVVSKETFLSKKIVERHAMHPSLTAFTSAQGHHGAALTHEGPRALAKIVQKVGGETLNMSKALLGIKGK